MISSFLINGFAFLCLFHTPESPSLENRILVFEDSPTVAQSHRDKAIACDARKDGNSAYFTLAHDRSAPDGFDNAIVVFAEPLPPINSRAQSVLVDVTESAIYNSPSERWVFMGWAAIVALVVISICLVAYLINRRYKSNFHEHNVTGDHFRPFPGQHSGSAPQHVNGSEARQTESEDDFWM